MNFSSKKKNPIKKITFIFLFLIGTISCLLLGLYIISFFIFVLGDSEYPGDIAFIPKWIFLFCPLVPIFSKTKEVEEFFEYLVRKSGFLSL